MAADPNGVYKHGLTYATLSYIKKKENLYFLQPLQMKNFQIDPSVAIEILVQLQTTIRWYVLILTSHTFRHSHVLICSLNIRSLSLHKNDVFLDYNLKNPIYYVSMKHISIHKHQILFLSLI